MKTSLANKILLGASFVALLSAYPALAKDASVEAEASVGAKIQDSLEKTGKEIDKTTKEAGKSLRETYQDVKTYFTNKDDVKAVATLDTRNQVSANFLLGADVKGPKNQDVGEIKDILVDASGSAKRVIVNDGEIFGLGGKEASFDYDVVRGVNTDKDIIVTLNEASVKNAVSYDQDRIPAGLYSVNKIIGSKVVDDKGKAVAKIDDLTFDDDSADYLIVTFDSIMGMGGDKAALYYDALKMQNNGGKYTYKLNTSQTAQFQSYKSKTDTY